MQDGYERKNNIKVHAGGFRSFVYYVHWKAKVQDCAEASSSEKILGPLVNSPGRLLILTEQVFKMVEVEEVEALNLEYQKIEGLLEDKDSEFFLYNTAKWTYRGC